MYEFKVGILSIQDISQADWEVIYSLFGFHKAISVAIVGTRVRRGAEGQDRVAAAAAGQDPEPGGGLVEGGIGQGSSDKILNH